MTAHGDMKVTQSNMDDLMWRSHDHMWRTHDKGCTWDGGKFSLPKSFVTTGVNMESLTKSIRSTSPSLKRTRWLWNSCDSWGQRSAVYAGVSRPLMVSCMAVW